MSGDGDGPWVRVLVSLLKNVKLAGLTDDQHDRAIGCYVKLLLHLGKQPVLVQMHNRGFVSEGELRDLFGPHFRRKWGLNLLRVRGLLDPDPEGVFVHDWVEHQDLAKRVQTSRNRSRSTDRMHEIHGPRPAGRGKKDSANAQTGVSANASANALSAVSAELRERDKNPSPTPPPPPNPTKVEPQPPPPIDYAAGTKQLAHDLALKAINGIPLESFSTDTVARVATKILEHPNYAQMTPADHHAVVNQIIQTQYWRTPDGDWKPGYTGRPQLVFSHGAYDTARETLAVAHKQARRNSTESPKTRTLTPTERAYLERYGETP